MKDDNFILLAAVGLGLFVFMRQRAVAAPMVVGQAPGGSSAAQWANTLANGISALGNAFRGSSGAAGLGSWASSPMYKPYVQQGATTLGQAAAWRDADPDVNGSIADYLGAGDGLAFNPVAAAPWDWAASGGLYLG